jgi:formate transporter
MRSQPAPLVGAEARRRPLAGLGSGPAPLAGIEGRLPPEIAAQAETDGIAKAAQDGITLVALGVLGGAFISFGAVFATVALTGAEAMVPFGLARVVAGLVFGLGLSLVLLGGAQIFTGDVLMVMAWASGRLAARQVLRAWTLVWIGNLAGALGTAGLVFLADHHLFGAGQVGVTALRTAEAKAALPFGRAVALGMLCNTLVCLAIWLSLSSRLPAHRMLVTVLPIAAFVAAGFEHAVANMYFIGYGLLLKTGAAGAFWRTVQLEPDSFSALGIAGFAQNLLAVTIGNVVGGAMLVAGAYWLLYRRPRPGPG